MDKLFKGANKIWPAKSAIPILIIFFLLSTIIVISSMLFDRRNMEDDFYKFQICGKLDNS